MIHCLSIDYLSHGSFVTLIVGLGVFVIFGWALLQRKFFGKPSFLLAQLAMLWWLAAAFMELVSRDISCKVFWAGAAWLGIALLPTSWAFFLYDYSFCRMGLGRRWRRIVLAVGPAVILGLAVSNPWHGLFYGPGTKLEQIDGVWSVNYDHGVFFYASAFYLYSYMIACIGICFWGLVRSPPSYRNFFAVLLMITLAPVLGNLGYVFFGLTFFGFDPTPFLFSLVLLMLGWLIFTNRVFDIRTVAKETLFSNASNPVLVFDVGGEVAALNAEAERAFGDDLSVGSDLRACPYFGNWIEQALLQGKPSSPPTLELGERMFSLMLSPLEKPLDRKNPVMGWVLQCVDISERRTLEQALKKAADAADAASRSKSLFLANMSHEIRTPLNGVLGMADLLKDRMQGAEEREMLETIRHSGELLLRILNDILDVSKIEAGKLQLDEIVFEPAGSVRQAVAIHRIAAQAKGLELLVQCNEYLQLRRGDPVRFEQILHNLLSNAVKFTRQGKVHLRAYDLPGGDLRIEVEDTGMGMSESEIAVVFNDFQQGDGSIARRFGGTGLGLSIVKRLVDLMQGDIRLQSRPGSGTRVFVRLPLAPVVCTDVPQAPARPADLKGLRILIADDNRTNRALLAGVLSRMGAETATAGDGREALEIWQPGAFDLLLLDYSMPELSGTELLRVIRDKAIAAGVEPPPALCVSAHVSEQHSAEYSAAGFAGQVCKPFQSEELVVAIRRALLL